mgnify:CR=1 FL=1
MGERERKRGLMTNHSPGTLRYTVVKQMFSLRDCIVPCICGVVLGIGLCSFIIAALDTS